MLACSDLKCNGLITPNCVDKPEFSWKIKSDGINVNQASYEITVGDVWDSGIVPSSESCYIRYNGAPLKPRTRYSWKVKIRDNYGNSAESESYFETGLMGSMHGNFIAPDEDTGETAPTFAKSFRINKEIKSAKLYATAYGVYEAVLNGNRVGDIFMAPGFTSYNKRLQYQCYDIKDLLKQGSNIIEVTVGKGWCRSTLGWEMNAEGRQYADKPMLLADIYIDFSDGSSKIISTDDTWEWYKSPVIFSQIYYGETYDATLEGQRDKRKAVVCPISKNHIIPQECEPVRVTEKRKPSLIITPKNEKVLDFGQNMTGITEFSVKGKKGDEVILSFAETLDREGNFEPCTIRTDQKVRYILKGGTIEKYYTRFTFQGFRYVRIEKYPGEINPERFTALVLHSDIERTGYFKCSNELVNRLFENIIWGQRGNFLDIPTDCPQRNERLGWTGDAQVFAATGARNMNVLNFFRKWLRDLKADQAPSGITPMVVPNVLYDRSCAGWGDAATICPWEMYKAYGDAGILREQYESMKAWVDYVKTQTEGLIWNKGLQIGDWLAPDAEDETKRTGRTAKDLIATAYFAYSTLILAKTAKVLGYENDKVTYENLFEDIKKAYRNEFITPSGRIVCDTQTAHALTLAFGLASDKKRISRRLTELIDEYTGKPPKFSSFIGAKGKTEGGGKLSTGFLGTPYILRALSENGYTEEAYDLLLQEDMPSWLYTVKMGATTVWETWDEILEDGTVQNRPQSSLNHYAYGAVAEWLYGTVVGINIDENNPGYKKIIFRPAPTGKLKYAEAEIETIYGTVKSRWEWNDGTVIYEVMVPPNATAEFHYPDGRICCIGSGTYVFD